MSRVTEGEVRIRARLAGGIVASVDVRSDRPIAVAAAFVGKPLAEVERAVGLLHGLCGRSHAAAVRFAGAAATGTPIDAAEASRWTTRLAAERIGEHLRTMLSAAGGLATLAPDRIAALRELMAGLSTVWRRGRRNGQRPPASARRPNG